MHSERSVRSQRDREGTEQTERISSVSLPTRRLFPGGRRGFLVPTRATLPPGVERDGMIVGCELRDESWRAMV
jgi:hypothetical protein